MSSIATKISVEEYLQQEAKAKFKSEYHGGKVVAMAGANFNHNILVSNIIGLLWQCMQKEDCFVLPSDMLLALPECDKFVYPDVTIVCEEAKFTEQRYGLDVLVNPNIIIEVLSDSTELYDRSDKFRCYKTLPSLKQYVLVASEEMLVESYERTEDNFWLLQSEEDAHKSIKIGKCDMLLSNIYRKVGFGTQNKKK
ncbi:Uma2 family endonuclease [Thermoflexibacter ruber]|uniref:Endonuclease, Uma2 family (Restriction endonuclease fold) n=1 Tax=Thermoflexibacter ruber TaxID=1003 RepID=A0A1I2IMG0_9BACT|nr:Uma2 family endonuclease [Thermoflexibacter ruber]SFF42870.1 Endonuclease, Uma2 family (restriction endonuclease fold) [Thermoflexibacter ruber]